MGAEIRVQSFVRYVFAGWPVNLGSLTRYAGLVFKLPFRMVLHKGGRRLKTFAAELWLRLRDRQRSTYGALPQSIANAKLVLRFETADLLRQGPIETVRAVSNHYLKHRFDLLGSGWLQVRHGMTCYGLEGHVYHRGAATMADTKGEWLRTRVNHSNLAYAQYVWSLVTQDYVPIDWHIDFKSGYRWAESVWYRDIQFGHLPGVDVKVPWELARMQHLPQLARAYALAVAGAEGFCRPDVYALEFRNQILDFVSCNPPRYGVNWWCAMDVGIRTVNWLMAYDLFMSGGAAFDQKFDQVFRLSVYQHGQHIVNNLEWHAEFRGNHYLSDIVGLLFVASYLPCDAEIDAWLAFAVQELIVEVKGQFHDDGGNFEASTSYHRLSAELVVYATALVVGLSEIKRAALSSYDHNFIGRVPKLHPAPIRIFMVPGTKAQSPFPEWYWRRLGKMAEFTKSILRPDNLSPQIGDNDSGRLLKISTRYDAMTILDARRRYLNLKNFNGLPDADTYWLEIINDHRHLIAAFNGICDRKDSDLIGEDFLLETCLIGHLATNIRVPTETLVPSLDRPSKYKARDPAANQNRTGGQSYVFTAPVLGNDRPDLTTGLRCEPYPLFGLYVYRSLRLYLTVRCGAIGLNGLGAHAHNDPLSIELWIDGRPIIMDPGSYIYTPLPERRDSFRSIAAHFSPHFRGRESGDLGLGVFALGNEAKAVCTAFSRQQFSGHYQCGAITIFRTISIGGHVIFVDDWSTSLEQSLCRLDPVCFNVESAQYSDGYGRVSAGTMI